MRMVKTMTMLFDQGYVTEVALKASKREGEARGVAKGIFKTLYELVRDNLLSMANAAKKAGQTEEEFTADMSSYFAQGGA